MTIPQDTITKLRDVWSSISEFAADLDESQWKTATDLPGWTVQDNLSHLIGTESALQGLPRPDHQAPEVDYVKNPIGAMNEIDADSRRNLKGTDVLAEWNDLVALRLATFAAGDDAYFEQAAMTPTGPGTLADFLHIRVMDCWAHEQDMRRAVGRPGDLDSASAAHSVDRLTRTLPIVIGKRAGTPEGAVVTFDMTGPIERHLVYQVVDGRAGLVEASDVAPMAGVSMDSETFTILAFGRRPAADLLDRISFAGDAEHCRRIVDSLNMMI